MANVTLNLKIKGTSLTMGAMGPVIDWYNNNSGNFPGKVELKRNGKFVQAMIDGNAIGNIQDENGKAYACPDCSFDDNGNCLDDYELVITGGDLSGTNQLLATLTIHIVESTSTTEYEDGIFDEEIKRIVSDGIETEEVVRENIRIMQLNNVSTNIILAVLARYDEKLPVPAHVSDTIYHPDKPENKYMEDALVSILCGRAVLFEGGQSVGKNVLVENLAQVLHLPYSLFTWGEDTTTSDLISSKSTKKSEAYQLTEDLMGKALDGDRDAKIQVELIKARSATVQIEDVLGHIAGNINRNVLLCGNEQNLGESNLSSKILNQLLDGTGFVDIPGYGRIKVHPKFIYIATQNPGAEGTQRQNIPTMTRFDTIQFGYPENVTEILKAGVAGELRRQYRRFSAINPRLAEAYNKSIDDIDPTVWKQCNKLHMECVRANADGVIGEAAVNIRGMVAAIVQAFVMGADIKRRIQVTIGNNACLGKDEKATYHQKLDERF